MVLSAETTADLVIRARRGEAQAFAALVRGYLRAAYAVALTIVGRPADAEDVAQDVFLVVYQRLDTCREPQRFAAWLFQIARNQARNWLDRRRLRDVPRSEDEPEIQVEGQAMGAALRRPLLKALQQLPPIQREVVLLHDMDGWTHAEIAEALNTSELMSRQHLFNARRKLRALLGEQESSEVEHG